MNTKNEIELNLPEMIDALSIAIASLVGTARPSRKILAAVVSLRMLREAMANHLAEEANDKDWEVIAEKLSALDPRFRAGCERAAEKTSRIARELNIPEDDVTDAIVSHMEDQLRVAGVDTVVLRARLADAVNRQDADAITALMTEVKTKLRGTRRRTKP